jgi:hypothetical protein
MKDSEMPGPSTREYINNVLTMAIEEGHTVECIIDALDYHLKIAKAMKVVKDHGGYRGNPGEWLIPVVSKEAADELVEQIGSGVGKATYFEIGVNGVDRSQYPTVTEDGGGHL